MKLYEYMGKEIFLREGIAVPRGRVFHSSEGVAEYVAKLGAVVVKSQILSGGRGKNGGIRFAATPGEAEKTAGELLNSFVKDFSVQSVLVEEQLTIEREYYLAITVDGAVGKPLIIASTYGGVNIEDVAEEFIVKMHVDVHAGVQPYLGREVARRMGLAPGDMKQFAAFLCKIYELFRKYDAELVEINPLVVCGGSMLAADAKITLDHDASIGFPTGYRGWRPEIKGN
ncbi:hypothetical protein N752_14150 [Desulforamulus aquiferis]|nr:ATP-grasp domain-containing protein [Desulforamulus aquiferis]RYD04511.1 hypothetical protein N752_14150 [Desulforamulus aquiferis]